MGAIGSLGRCRHLLSLAGAVPVMVASGILPESCASGSIGRISDDGASDIYERACYNRSSSGGPSFLFPEMLKWTCDKGTLWIGIVVGTVKESEIGI